VRVIEKGLVSEADFERAQELMRLKATHHWRTRSYYEHRFVYGGFLFCGHCEKILYSAYRRRDYYVCKGRRLEHACPTRYFSP